MQCIISRWRCVWSGRYSRCWVFAWRRVRIVKVSCRLLSRKLWTWMTETLVSNLYKNSYWMYFTHLLLLSLVYISFLLFFFYVFLLSLLFSNLPMLLSCVCQLIINVDDDDDDDDKQINVMPQAASLVVLVFIAVFRLPFCASSSDSLTKWTTGGINSLISRRLTNFPPTDTIRTSSSGSLRRGTNFSTSRHSRRSKYILFQLPPCSMTDSLHRPMHDTFVHA